MQSTWPSPNLIALGRFVGIFAPTLYCGFTASDSLNAINPILDHAPNQKVAAKQWYQGYRYGPYWVTPMIVPGTLANLYLALTSTSTTQSYAYIAAAVGTFSIFPITFLYMEPGVNGASKWKVESLLKDEGFSLPETSIFRPSAVKHGATQASRRWAEKTDMKDLIRFWQQVNMWRWIITGVAAVVSGYATLVM